MFEKRSNNNNKMSVEALHVPTGGAWDFYNTSRIKTASIDKTKKTDLGGFDLQAAISKNPDNLFVKVFAIKANEVNDNGDCFSEQELEKSAHTFIGVPVFVNHQNDNIENARGKVVHSWYDESSKGIYCINMVDRAAYPKLARGIEEGYITGTSMGAQVTYSICSVCHNKAHTADEFCSHIKGGKNRKISGKYECKYHHSPCNPEDDCPLDGKKKSENKEIIHKESQVFEWNYGIKFIEDSFVVNPACHDCLVCDILNLDNVKTKVADKIEELKKVASSLSGFIGTMKEGSLEKTAGKAELQALTQAMNLMEHVARSMMAQKQQVQLDYVSDLVEQLAKVQSLTDELTEMGYAQLPSPPEQAIALGNVMSLGDNISQQSSASQPPQQQPPQSYAPSSQPSSSQPPQSGAMDGGIGSITRPSFVGASVDLKKDFLRQGENISNKLESVSSALRASIILLAQRSKEVAESEQIAEFSSGDTKVVVANVDNSGIIFGKFKDNKLVSWASVDEFGDDIKSLANSNPQEAAKLVLNQYQKESGVNMSANKTTKVAGSESSQFDVTTQKQLDNAGPLHPREDKAPTVTTQAQLDGDGELKPVNDTTSDDNQLRKGNSPEVITQAQLDSIEHDDIARWDSHPEVITEAQWTEMSRRVSSSLGSDYTEQVTQAQLESLQKSHKWTAPEVITQAQLNEQKKVSPEGKSDSARLAYSAKDLVKAASNTVADAIANYGLTPAEVSSAIGKMSSSPFASIKAGYLALINASPSKVKARLAERNRKNYFAKLASSNNSKVRAVDSFLAAMGDNIGYLKAEDFVDAIRFVASDKKAFAAAESLAHTKLASATNSSEDVVVSKEDIFREAFASLDRPEDGLYKICGTLTDDVSVDPDNKNQFMKAMFAFAQQHINVPFVITNIKLDKEAGIFETECKEEQFCSSQEKKAFSYVMNGQMKVSNTVKTEAPKVEKKARSINRANLLKEAQMMGGQMGGGMGGGGPAGGMGSTMPGADAGMGGAPAAESLSGPGDDLGEGQDDMMGGEEGDMQPKPPGTICPVCGSSDVDVLDGKGKCGNCAAEFSYKVELEITKYPGLLDSGDEEEEGSAGLGGEGEEGGEGFALPGGEEPASLPVAATTRLNPAMLKKAAEDAKLRGQEWSLGSISPYTGSNSVMKISNNKFLCLDTGSTYEVHVAGVDKGGKKAVFAEWRFEAKPLSRGCESCRRKKASFVNSLKSAGISEDTFDSMMLFDKGEAIIAMKNKGLLNPVKLASKNSLLNGLKKTASYGGKFPIETCREKIARKYGENALAMSGPCEGKNLADCVCQKLSTAGVYANDIAIKVASIWSNEDLMVTCVEDFVRSRKFSMKQACFICDQLKAKYAQFEDHLADELGGSETPSPSPSPTDGGGDGMESDGMGSGGGELSDDIDPFSDDMGGELNESGVGDTGGEMADNPLNGTITIELPLEVIEQFDAAIDMAKGENPAEEPHHNMPLDGTATVELPGEVAEGVDEMADQALDSAVDATQEVGEAVGGALDAVQDAVQEAPGVVDSDPVELKEDVAPESESVEIQVSPETGGDNFGDSEESNFGSDEGEEGGSDEGEEENNEENSEEKEESSTDFSNDSEDGSEEKEFMAQAESSMNVFKKGKIASSNGVNLDLSSVIKVLASQGKIAKEVTLKNVQDHTEDFGKIRDGGTMGNEDKFDAKDPDVFSGDATMGGEKDADLSPVTNKPEFDAGGGEMGHEKELGYTSEKEHEATGGTQGAGKSASSKQRVSALADRIVGAAKTASDKKLEKSKPVSEDESTKPYSANKDIAKSGNPITPFDSADIGKVEAGDSSFMGHEKETLVNVPKEDNSAPSIPAGGGTNSKYDKNEKNAPEKQTAHKGTVIAGRDAESLAARKEAATRVAGRKLKAGMISIDKLASEIDKLARYEPSDLRDLETALFGASKKGLDTVAKGSEKPFVISEQSNQRKIGEELKDSLQSMFKLDKANKLAQEDPNVEIRKNFRR